MINFEIDTSSLNKTLTDIQKDVEFNMLASVDATIEEGVDLAYGTAPVRTGWLRDHIVKKIDWDNFSNIVSGWYKSSETEYAKYVEFGTNRQRPQHFFGVTVSQISRFLSETVEQNLKHAIRIHKK